MVQVTRRLSCDTEVRKDLMQEMILVLLELPEGKEDNFYMSCAKYTAIDFMRKFYFNREIPFSQLDDKDKNDVREKIDFDDEEDE